MKRQTFFGQNNITAANFYANIYTSIQANHGQRSPLNFNPPPPHQSLPFGMSGTK